MDAELTGKCLAIESVSAQYCQSALPEQDMTDFYASPDVTAFVSTRKVDSWHVGVVTVLQGRRPTRVEEECLAPRDTTTEALQDARRLACEVIAAWRDKVKL